MEKIVIIGSSGAGKSTLARALGAILKINVIHLDRLFWQPDWKGKTKDRRIDILLSLVREKRWIIEGTYLNSSEDLHLHAADTIIFLDTPFFLCLQRLIKRHLEYYGRHRRDLPMGCTDKLTLRHMFKTLFFPLQDGRTLKHKLRNYNNVKQIICFHSTKEVNAFLARKAQIVDSMRYVSLEEDTKSYPGLLAPFLQYLTGSRI
jgi:adenylate kinase family enzyme